MHKNLISSSLNTKTSIHLLGVRIDVLTQKKFQDQLMSYIQQGQRGWLGYVNVHTIEVAHQLPWYKQFLEQSLIAYCDGEGVRLGAFLSGAFIPERITLSTYIYGLAKFATEHRLNIFLLGGTTEVIDLSVRKLQALYPALRITGYHHGYFSEEENTTVVQLINEAQPDILLLGMGVPKQEEWTRKNFEALNTKIIWMGGGFLDTLAGTKKQCPVWLGNVGLEWLFRLAQEPRRLWKRYLIGNPMFILRVLRFRFHRVS
jgi:N-acetylglucosaminyldiphosphoundecaprenol N-acetyl-beta-D-mannosaminyltransferase